ncbi:conserved membrane protein of unknown function [Modestobacter italicus]|uniref:Uncharacterized protein n=1 Tax=Modestobacter italicus (strain DSM 44449 / CECT 9708 / BC 501) TaxID=2732864 RepID=I4ETG0_MODI5|nr:conserved membrane protein of unknown function [Modestobacter marinus]
MRIRWPWKRTPPAATAELDSLASTLPARAWREEALARAAEIQALSDWMDNLQEPRGETDSDADTRLADAIRSHVAAVQKAASGGRPRLHTSARLARATSNIHAAETDLLRRAPERYLRGELPSMDAHVRRHLPVDDPRRVRIEDIARRDLDDGNGHGALHPRDRESIIAAMRAASSAAAREQQRVRSFGAIISWASVLLFTIAGLVALLGILRPQLLALCFEPQPTPTEPPMLICPTGQSVLPDGEGSSGADIDATVQSTVSKWDVPLIEIIGIVAAGVTGAIALRRIQGTSTPFTVPVVLNVLKLPTGALTAVLGLLLMRGGFVPGLTALDSTPQVLAWAVVFGASQQLFTGMVDRQAASVLDATGDKTYKATTG